MFLSKGYKGNYYLYYTDNFNKRRKISTGTKKKPIALTFLQNFSYEKSEKQKIFDKTNISFDELTNEVLKYVNANLSKSTVSLYKRLLKDFKRINGNIPIKHITFKEIELFKQVRLTEVTKTTVNIDLRTLKAVLNLAIKWNWINENPMKAVKLLDIPEKQHKAFNENEINLILNSIKDAILKGIVLFAYLTGARLNEILNVQIEDVNFIEGFINIINKDTFTTKTKRNRQIPISDKLNIFLNEHLGINNKIIELNTKRCLFVNDKGCKLRKDTVSMKFKKVLRALHLPEFYSFHSLRHTFISSLIKSGVNINYVKELAGHSKLETTMRYIHLNFNDLKTAINKISL